MMRRGLAYVWASPTTCLGLLLVPLAAVGGRIAFVDGVVECCGPLAKRVLARCGPCGGVAAIALGHVIVAQDVESLEWTRSHERVHVWQYECWGPLFLPAYGVASLLALLRGLDPYLDNYFERQARLMAGY